MGVLAEQQLATALGAVAEGNPERASQAIAGDAAIDLMQSEVEDWGVRILAMRQPVAIDLRNIIGAMRSAGDLERIGDMAKNIGKGITSFDQSAWASPMTKSLCAMGETALLQLEAVLDSYAKRDPELALNVWMRDQEIDQQYVYKPGLDLTVSVWMGGRVYRPAVVRQQSFFPPQSALRQGMSASASCRSTSVPGAVCSY